jgi:hypothetical protein
MERNRGGKGRKDRRQENRYRRRAHAGWIPGYGGSKKVGQKPRSGIERRDTVRGAYSARDNPEDAVTPRRRLLTSQTGTEYCSGHSFSRKTTLTESCQHFFFGSTIPTTECFFFFFFFLDSSDYYCILAAPQTIYKPSAVNISTRLRLLLKCIPWHILAFRWVDDH